MSNNSRAVEPDTNKVSGLIEVTVIVLWGGLQAAALGIAWSKQPAAGTTHSVVARCDRLAQIVSTRNLASSGDAHGVQWRRGRENAFSACLEDPDRFSRLQDVH